MAISLYSRQISNELNADAWEIIYGKSVLMLPKKKHNLVRNFSTFFSKCMVFPTPALKNGYPGLYKRSCAGTHSSFLWIGWTSLRQFCSDRNFQIVICNLECLVPFFNCFYGTNCLTRLLTRPSAAAWPLEIYFLCHTILYLDLLQEDLKSCITFRCVGKITVIFLRSSVS